MEASRSYQTTANSGGMTWEQFRALWAAYFRPITDQTDGVDEWRRFVAGVYSVRLLRDTVEELARKRAEILKANPNAQISQPKLMDVRLLFNAKAADRRDKYQQEQAQGCPLCKGGMHVTVAVSTAPGHPVMIPEESSWRDFSGLMAYPCPKCNPQYYAGNGDLARVVEKGCGDSGEIVSRFKDYQELKNKREMK